MFACAETHRKKSERVLVYSELGISRAATAVMAYLIKRNNCTLEVGPYEIHLCVKMTQARVNPHCTVVPFWELLTSVESDWLYVQFLYSTHFQVIQLSNTTHESYELITQEAYGHVQTCRQHIQPLAIFKEQLSCWETQILDSSRH